MFRELIGREDELAIGDGIRRVAVRFVKGIDDQRPGDFNRPGILVVEHHPPPEAASCRLSSLVHDGIAPHADDPHR